MAQAPRKSFGGWYEIATEFHNLDTGPAERRNRFRRSRTGLQRWQESRRNVFVRLRLGRGGDGTIRHRTVAGDRGNPRVEVRRATGAGAGSRGILRTAGGGPSAGPPR